MASAWGDSWGNAWGDAWGKRSSPVPKKPTGGGGSWLDQDRTRQEIIDIQDNEAIFVISVAVAALNKLK